VHAADGQGPIERGMLAGFLSLRNERRQQERVFKVRRNSRPANGSRSKTNNARSEGQKPPTIRLKNAIFRQDVDVHGLLVEW
jgi:hypothetical protein